MLETFFPSLSKRRTSRFYAALFVLERAKLDINLMGAAAAAAAASPETLREPLADL